MPATGHKSGANVFWRAPEGKRGRSSARPWVGLALALGLLLYVLVFGDAGWVAVRAERSEVDRLQEEVAELRAEQAVYEQKTAELLEPGSLELERVAREEYRMKAPGEEIHHLVGNAESGSAETGSREP